MRARQALPDLLKEDISTWKSMYITYEYPHVQRLWKTFENDARVYLHIIESIPEKVRKSGVRPLFHPHPWPSAVMLMNGAYRMSMRNLWTTDDEIKRTILTEGSSYEMNHPADMHSVDPIDFEVMSLMVTGKPYDPPPKMFPAMKQPELSADMAERLHSGFKALLKLRPGMGYHPEVLQ
jgi:hypothetical protein